MTNATSLTASAIALALATALTATPANAFLNAPIQSPTITNDLIVDVQAAQFSLSPGDFKGFDGSGKRQRVRIRTAGNGYTLQTLTGRNSGQVFYVHKGGNIFQAADGTTLEVTSRRSAVWNGWLGRIALND
ncbi:MAG: hypothetical protein AAGG69_04510 [Pseudomonadota bacterium]